MHACRNKRIHCIGIHALTLNNTELKYKKNSVLIFTVRITSCNLTKTCFYSVLSTYLIFSSGVPFVNSTKPHKSSLNAIPFCVPPQATYNQSASTDGIPSDRTSCRKATLLNDEPFDPDDFLNASLMRRNSVCVTVKNNKNKKTIKNH